MNWLSPFADYYNKEIISFYKAGNLLKIIIIVDT
jgi:hypothetical protein